MDLGLIIGVFNRKELIHFCGVQMQCALSGFANGPSVLKFKNVKKCGKGRYNWMVKIVEWAKESRPKNDFFRGRKRLISIFKPLLSGLRGFYDAEEIIAEGDWPYIFLNSWLKYLRSLKPTNAEISLTLSFC